MSGSDFYLICFAVGFLLSFVALLGGSLHLPHVHVHLHHTGFGHAGHATGKGGASPLNFGTVAAFLAWFGAAGYLITRFSDTWFVVVIGGAALSGLAGSALVFWFLLRLMRAGSKPLDPADYEMTGVLGRISSTVHQGGTGEMIFSQEGCRRGVAVRSEGGRAIPKGSEVVVTRYEKGIAYVREWDELT